MLEKQKGLIVLEDFFKEAYQYTYKSREDLLLQPFAEYEGVGATSLVWIYDGNDRYLLKKVNENEYTWLGELLSNKIAKFLHRPCATYRLATLEGKKVILSKDFLKEKETLILGVQIVQEVLNHYPYAKDNKIFSDEKFLELYAVPKNILGFDATLKNKYLHNNLNNLEQMWSILSLYCDLKKIPSDLIPSLMDSLTQTFLFDVYTFQADRHIQNWGFIQEKKGEQILLKPNILFDQAASFGLYNKDLDKRIKDVYDRLHIYQKFQTEKAKENFINILYKDRLLLTPSEDAIINAKSRKRQNNLQVFSYFLEVSSSEMRQKVEEEIEALEQHGMTNFLKEIMEENEITIDPNVVQYLETTFSYHLFYLKEKVKKYQRSR